MKHLNKNLLIVQPNHLKIVIDPPVDDLNVLENVIHDHAQAGEREALRQALWDYLKAWGIQRSGNKKPLPGHDKGVLTLRANSKIGA